MVFCYVGTKTFTYSHKKIRIFGQKRPNLVQNLHFWSYWAKYCHFLHILSNAQPKNNANKVPRWVFRMWMTKLLISSVKIRIFGPKMAFLFILGQALPAHLVGGCGTRAVSRKTPIYFIQTDVRKSILPKYDSFPLN